MKVLIALGATGGHVYPGIALGEELAKHGDEVFWTVPDKPLIPGIARLKGAKIYKIPSASFPRKVRRISYFFCQQFLGLIYGIIAITSTRCDVVVAMGSYASVPVALAAALKFKPLIVFEQNTVPGLATRFIGVFASKVALTFPESQSYFSGYNTVITGMPVRNAILHRNKTESLKALGIKPNRFTILILGGSQGAKGINKVVIGTLPLLENIRNEVQFVHITGKSDYDSIQRAYKQAGLLAKTFPFLEDIQHAYAVVDIAISRSGASAVTELALSCIPAILIPFPYETDGHQTANAAYVVQHGGGVMYHESSLKPDILACEINRFLKNEKIRRTMSEAASTIFLSDGVERLVNVIESAVCLKQ